MNRVPTSTMGFGATQRRRRAREPTDQVSASRLRRRRQSFLLDRWISPAAVVRKPHASR